MNKEFVLNTIKECNLWKEGQFKKFQYTDSHGNSWDLIFRKEGKLYLPFKYSIYGKKLGTYETISRHYVSAENAFLNVLNCFNKNANIKNIYHSLDEAFEKM